MQYLKDWGNHLHIPEHDSLRLWCSKGHVRGCPVSGLRCSHLTKSLSSALGRLNAAGLSALRAHLMPWAHAAAAVQLIGAYGMLDLLGV